ncbi:GGDEF domain-containing protein [Curvibacter sp. CHRR-16]|uniref:sensor domain-containing diguanylate cyclase n=1 Tax=Curvibacter sp. CHRR-16 TaxID=2835872 RepID=UPI001BDABAFC|nr:GGDEF domain-containing protein [Curvibacter sp. CHRR-16]MBT0569768.1 GGDEF domain-containing protein [Curvibacter sp. CHRR-16]
MKKNVFIALPSRWGMVGVTVAICCSLIALALGGAYGVSWGLVSILCMALLHFGIAEHMRRYRALQESSRRLILLAEMNVRVNRDILLNEDIELIYGTILNYLFSVFNTATTGSVLILGDDGYLTFAASRGFTEEFVSNFRLRLEDCFLYQVTDGHIREARLINREDFHTVETVIKPEVWEYKSVISAPIFVGDRLFGLLNLDSSVNDTYDITDVSIVERIRAQIEIALLARERYTDRIKRYQVDALTGVLTRGYFDDLFAHALQQAQNDKQSFVLALFDVDGLKTTNDLHGHLAGDQMLMAVASALYASCGTRDIMGRFGGDEFIALYTGDSMEAIDQALKQVRSQLQPLPMLYGGVELRPAFSYGLARFPHDGQDQQSLIAVADKHLYAMKFANR